ncbi:MAG: hypothetical protein ACETWR_01825 [Anaerolineae bacterium]
MTSAGYKGIVKGNVVVLQEPDWEADPFLRVDEWLPDLPWEEVPPDLSVRHDDCGAVGCR